MEAGPRAPLMGHWARDSSCFLTSMFLPSATARLVVARNNDEFVQSMNLGLYGWSASLGGVSSRRRRNAKLPSYEVCCTHMHCNFSSIRLYKVISGLVDSEHGWATQLFSAQATVRVHRSAYHPVRVKPPPQVHTACFLSCTDTSWISPTSKVTLYTPSIHS